MEALVTFCNTWNCICTKHTKLKQIKSNQGSSVCNNSYMYGGLCNIRTFLFSSLRVNTFRHITTLPFRPFGITKWANKNQYLVSWHYRTYFGQKRGINFTVLRQNKKSPEPLSTQGLVVNGWNFGWTIPLKPGSQIRAPHSGKTEHDPITTLSQNTTPTGRLYLRTGVNTYCLSHSRIWMHWQQKTSYPTKNNTTGLTGHLSLSAVSFGKVRHKASDRLRGSIQL